MVLRLPDQWGLAESAAESLFGKVSAMQIMVSAQILAHMRTLVGASIPASKSSHRAEALASALGFNSNAALIAWQNAVARSDVRMRELDSKAFAERLGVLSGIPDIDGGIAVSSSRQVLAAVTGPSFDETMAAGQSAFFSDEAKAMTDRERIEKMGFLIDDVTQAGQKAFFADNPSGDWGALTSRQKFTQMAFLLRWRMLMMGMVANMVEDFSDGTDVAGHLAASFERHADYDPLIAGFLSDWLLVARSKQDAGWGDMIYTTFRPRIKAFMEAVCRTWSDDIDPLTLEPTGKRYKPGKGDHRTVSTSVAPCDHLSFWDAGLDEASDTAIPGLALMAHWMAGASHEELSRLALRIREAGYGDLAPGVKLVDETGAELTATEIMNAGPAPYTLDEIRPGGFEFWSKASVVLAEVGMAARAFDLMRDAGYHVIKLDASQPDFEQRFRSSFRMAPEMLWIENAGDVSFDHLSKLDVFSVLAFVTDAKPDVAAQVMGLPSSLDLRSDPALKPS